VVAVERAVRIEKARELPGEFTVEPGGDASSALDVASEEVKVSYELFEEDDLDVDFADLGKEDLFGKLLDDYELLLNDNSFLDAADRLIDDDKFARVSISSEVSSSKEVVETLQPLKASPAV